MNDPVSAISGKHICPMCFSHCLTGPLWPFGIMMQPSNLSKSSGAAMSSRQLLFYQHRSRAVMSKIRQAATALVTAVCDRRSHLYRPKMALQLISISFCHLGVFSCKGTFSARNFTNDDVGFNVLFLIGMSALNKIGPVRPRLCSASQKRQLQ